MNVGNVLPILHGKEPCFLTVLLPGSKDWGILTHKPLPLLLSPGVCSLGRWKTTFSPAAQLCLLSHGERWGWVRRSCSMCTALCPSGTLSYSITGRGMGGQMRGLQYNCWGWHSVQLSFSLGGWRSPNTTDHVDTKCSLCPITELWGQKNQEAT